MWFGGIAAAVIKRLSTRAQDAKREQSRRPLNAYADWHLNRGEGDETKVWEQDRRLLGTHAYKTRLGPAPEQCALVGTPKSRRKRQRC